MNQLERLERKEEKALIKQNLELVKQVRIWFASRYQNFVEDIINNKFDEEDVLLFLNEQEPIYSSIERIKVKAEEKRKRDVYDAIVNNNKPLIKRLLEECRVNLVLLKEELKRTNNWSPFSQKEIVSKERKIKKLEHNIEEANALMQKLMEKEETNKKQNAKKRGRPSKEETIKNKINDFVDEVAETQEE